MKSPLMGARETLSSRVSLDILSYSILGHQTADTSAEGSVHITDVFCAAREATTVLLREGDICKASLYVLYFSSLHQCFIWHRFEKHCVRLLSPTWEIECRGEGLYQSNNHPGKSHFLIHPFPSKEYLPAPPHCIPTLPCPLTLTLALLVAGVTAAVATV